MPNVDSMQASQRSVLASASLFLTMLATSTANHAETVTVFAAASLNNALTEIAKQFESTHPNDKIQLSFAGSSTLAKQIQAGAPAQIFISADQNWMDKLSQNQLIIIKTRINILANQLVLITPKNQSFSTIMDKKYHLPQAFSGKICLANPDSVPAGKYAKQALTALGWWNDLQARVVPTEDVRSALAFVARGECPVGVVYTTDAYISDKVTIIGTFPVSSHSPIVYPMALLKPQSHQNSGGSVSQDFWQYVQQKSAQTVFQKYGFGQDK